MVTYFLSLKYSNLLLFLNLISSLIPFISFSLDLFNLHYTWCTDACPVRAFWPAWRRFPPNPTSSTTPLNTVPKDKDSSRFPHSDWTVPYSCSSAGKSLRFYSLSYSPHPSTNLQFYKLFHFTSVVYIVSSLSCNSVHSSWNTRHLLNNKLLVHQISKVGFNPLIRSIRLIIMASEFYHTPLF
jgi:hypothetical protein